MKQVLISIRPEWVAKILNGEKNAEVRLNVPKCDLPCEVFIYCTKGGKKLQGLNGKVVAKFILNETVGFGISKKNHHIAFDKINSFMFMDKGLKEMTGLTYDMLKEYVGDKQGYFWKIDNLEVFDTPKELGDFYKNGTMTKEEYIAKAKTVECIIKEMEHNYQDAMSIINIGYDKYIELRSVTHAPQSWCYVRENK